MSVTTGSVEFGTCSWNYESWVGLVYSRAERRAAAYLPEYARSFNTVEVDSWFYKIPNPEDANEYASLVPPGFTFACKLTESISLTHERNRDKSAPLEPNPDFLSVDRYAEYVAAIEGLRDKVFMLELEFEYLNKRKMSGVDAFMRSLETFIEGIDASSVGRASPIGIECRNANYLTREYFRFLKDHGIAHVFSEKRYLPHIYELYAKHGNLIGDRVAIRLLGGDRREIEEKTKGNWNEIVEPKEDIVEIGSMISDLVAGGRIVKVYLNNHYEGSAPMSILRMRERTKTDGQEQGAL